MKAPRQFLLFCAVGTAGFLIDLGILYALSPKFGWYGARLLSFWGAASFTWLLNRILTFSNTKLSGLRATWHQYLNYLLAMLGGAAVNYLVYVTILQLGQGYSNPALGVALGSVAGLCINFASARHLVFRAKQPPATKP